MYKRGVSVIMRVLFLMAALAGAWSVQPAWGRDKDMTHHRPVNGRSDQQITLKEARNQAAAIRKSKGQMRSTTNDDRWAAAKRRSSRHAAAVAKGKGGSK